MGLRQYEAAILAELRTVSGKRRLRQSDIEEWSTGDVERVEGEVVYRLPVLGVNVAVKGAAIEKR
jgi:hypothetical protein